MNVAKDAADALAALPQPQATTVGVKALEWAADGRGGWWAGTPFGWRYVVTGSDWIISGDPWAPINRCASDDAAKSAAQLDFDTRIRSALIGIPGAEAVNDLIHEAQEIADYADEGGTAFNGIDMVPLIHALAAVRRIPGAEKGEMMPTA